MFTKQKRGLKFSLLLLTAVLVLTTLSNTLAIFISNATAATPGGTWIDQTHISYGGQVFTDTKIDDTWEYYDNASSSSSDCNNFIHNFDGGETKPTGGTIEKNPTGADFVTRVKNPATGGCISKTSIHISLAEVPDAHSDFTWQDGTTVQAVTGDVLVQGTGGLFYEQGGDQCKDTLQFTSNNSAKLTIRTGSHKTSYDSQNLWINQYVRSGANNLSSVDGCNVFPAFTVSVSNFDNARAKTGGSSGVAQSGGSGSGSSSSSGSSSCEAQGGTLSWVICPILELMDNAVATLDQQIQAQLQTPDPTKVKDANGKGNINQLKETWGRLRNIALIILVPVMLVMVIGTAIGVSALDAYTVKRAMPRLLIAVIFISLSWYITSFLINLTNVVGAGVYGLMTTPFGVADKTLSSFIGGGAAGSTIVGLSVFGGILAGAAGALSIPIFLSIAFTAAAALFLGFLILVLRQVLIFLLILLAPLAILAWIFPSNNKLWNLWWDSFSKLLLMYPLVIALIAAGRIGASVIPYQQGSNGFFTKMLIIVAYITPYFLIPATFKFAGGVFANLSGIVNDRGRGLFDRSKKFRQEERAKNFQEAQAGNRFKGGNANNLRGRFNTRIQQGTIAATGKAGLAPFKKGRISSVATASALQEIEKNEKENTEYLAWAGNDDLNKFAAYSTDEASLRRQMIDSGKYVGREAQMEQDVSRVERVRRSMSAPAFRQMTALHAIAGGTTLDTDDSHNGVEWLQLAAMAAGNDDAALANLVNKGKSAAMAAGRADQGAASFGTAFSAARDIRDSGYSKQAIAEAGQRVHDNVLDSAGAGILAHSSMKPNTLKRLVPDMKRRLSEAHAESVRTGDSANYERQLATFANLYDQMSGSSPQNAQYLADEVMRWSPSDRPEVQQIGVGQQGPVVPGRRGPTIQDDLLTFRSGTVFTSTRRELSNEPRGGNLTPEQQAAQNRLGGSGGNPTDTPGQQNFGPP